MAAAWLIAAAALARRGHAERSARKLNDLLSNRFDLPGTESEQRSRCSSDHFGQRDDSGYTLVFSGDVAPAAERRR